MLFLRKWKWFAVFTWKNIWIQQLQIIFINITKHLYKSQKHDIMYLVRRKRTFQDWFKQSILRNILRSRIQAGSAKDSRGKKKTPKKTEYSRGKEKIVWMKGGMLLFERDSSHFFTVPCNGSCIIWFKRRKDSK